MMYAKEQDPFYKEKPSPDSGGQGEFPEEWRLRWHLVNKEKVARKSG